ncbi:MAG: DUF4131 domain-containing protein [Synechococcaceae cyanobacterium RL_1_2]|nr:DUF4131 domain-containing protein [Synechococcaceae cyanobacterium RL_1_2]
MMISRYGPTGICLAYMAGIGLIQLLSSTTDELSFSLWLVVIGILAALAMLSAWLLPKFWLRSPRGNVWAILALVALLGAIYSQWRVPSPQGNDISFKLTDRVPATMVVGEVVGDRPKLNAKRGS